MSWFTNERLADLAQRAAEYDLPDDMGCGPRDRPCEPFRRHRESRYDQSMKNALIALLSSRKTWVGLLTVFSVVGAVVLRALDKLPADALVPTIGAISSIGLGIIGSIAWEDVNRAKPAEAPTQNVTVNQPQPAPRETNG